MTIGIVGGGIMGITLGYMLTKRGMPVEILEASPELGGLAGPLTLPDGAQVDRFYHAILSSDAYLGGLIDELGLRDQLRFGETKTSFYYKGRLHSMNNIIEFLRFPPLGWIDRFRLGLTVLAAQFISDWRKLETISVEKWLLQWSGRGTFDNIWRPMLNAKFDGGFENTPATYIWSRLVRMKSTRGGASQKEMAGYLIGGYATLLAAMAREIQQAGNLIQLKTPVSEVVIENGRAVGLRVNGELRRYEAIAVTVQAPIFRRLIPTAPTEYLNFLDKTTYLGIVCPLLVLDGPLTPYWTVNITDTSIPFTGVIETTSYIDPAHVGGHNLVYLPKYTAPGSSLQKLSDEQIRAMWIENIKRMFPDFDERRIRYLLVHREKYVEPLHGLNETHLIPSVATPVQRLFLATTAQIYPALTNGESVTRHAAQTAESILATVQPATAGSTRSLPLAPKR
ncbi:MAG: NAD(P)/FAD-dependent oxidoreductase [Anaerolineales bacterium]|nr:NAD(P)/FAD-dependent oxidoreductase [Anaerolineales bacterium]